MRVLASAFRTRRALLLENLALRQQLATFVQKDHPRIGTADRVFWVVLRRLWSGWSDALIIREARDRGLLAPGRLQALLAVAVP